MPALVESSQAAASTALDGQRAPRPSGPGYASPADAIRAPREEVVYVAALHTGTGVEELKVRTGLSAPHTVHCMPGNNIVMSMLGDADGNDGAGFAVLDAEAFVVKGRWEADGRPGGTTTSGTTRATATWCPASGPRPHLRGRLRPGAGGRRPATAARSTSGTSRAARSSRTSTWATRAWSRWRSAGCTVPTPTRATSGPPCPRPCGTSSGAPTAASAPPR